MFFNRKILLNTVLYAVLILLPIDWFSPTGLAFREAGAKPLNLLLLVCMLILIAKGEKFFLAHTGPKILVQSYLMGIIICGSVAFLFNILFISLVVESDRTQIFQFISQSAMLVMFMAVLQTMIFFFSVTSVRQRVLDVLPIAACLHLLFYLLEAVNFFSQETPGILSLFRSEEGLIDRPSGLMSEPSYFGAFAAMYAVPLLFLSEKNKHIRWIIAVAILGAALIINAKTMFVVLSAQIFYLVVNVKSKRAKSIFILVIAIGIFILVYLLLNRPAVIINENLSSAMRVGSNMLALNIATEGYGLLGIGIGQFHFMYTPEFAPDYLLLSQEALDLMEGVTGRRASTFNLPLRLLVETGVIGFTLGAVMLFQVFWSLRNTTDPITKTGLSFVAASLGFLMTQDTYCLPSLAFGLALSLTGSVNAAAPTRADTT